MIVEVINVLSSRALYNLPRAEIERLLRRFCTLRGLTIPQKRTYQRALELWVNTPSVRDFTDALSVAHMERRKITTIVSFVRDFDRFPTIARQEPR